MRKVFIISVMNASYLLKGNEKDISDFFPELPKRKMSKGRKYLFAQKIRETVMPDGRTYKDCFSIHQSRSKCICHPYNFARMVWYGAYTTTFDEVAETVEKIIEYYKGDNSKFKDYEFLLLYLTKDHERFNDVRPLVEKLEEVIDDVLVYTENTEFSPKETKVRKKFGYKNCYRKLHDCIEERYGEDVVYHFSPMFPFYQYFGAEEAGYIKKDDWFRYNHRGDFYKFYNLEWRRLPNDSDVKKRDLSSV